MYRVGKKKQLRVNPLRLIRMGGFGLVFYGPFQQLWYRSLDYRFATSSLSDFLPKVNHISSEVSKSFSDAGCVESSCLGASCNQCFLRVGADAQTSTLPEKFRTDFVTTVSEWMEAVDSGSDC